MRSNYAFQATPSLRLARLNASIRRRKRAVDLRLDSGDPDFREVESRSSLLSLTAGTLYAESFEMG